MEGIIIALVLALLVFPIWTIWRVIALGRENEALAQKLAELDTELQQVKRTALRSATTETAVASAPQTAARPVTPIAPAAAPTVATTPPVTQPQPKPTPGPITPPPLPPSVPAAAKAASVPPPTRVVAPPPPRIPEPAREPEPSYWSRIDWEQFMGAKLFAWLGGLAGFLAAAYFIKYSFEHNWIPPEVRVAIGFLFSIGLVIGGLKIPRQRYAITAQTLIATGIVSLYAVTFACNSIYHFAFFGPIATFVVMALITTTAFLLAVRLDARVVAILGILGGFLTPILLSTGHDNPVGLFGYLALLDVGLIAVALNRRWYFLVPLGAAGTALMQVAWAAKFFTDAKAMTAAIVCVAFAAIFTAASAAVRKRQDHSRHTLGSAIGMACMCFAFALYFVARPELHDRPLFVFGFVFAADLCLFALTWIERRAAVVVVAAAGAAIIEAGWTLQSPNAATAPAAMAVAFVFGAIFVAVYFVARWLALQRPADRLTSIDQRESIPPREIAWSAAGMLFVAMGMAFAFIPSAPIAARVGLLFSFTLAVDVLLLAVAWFDEEMPRLHLAAGSAVFLIFAAWTASWLTNDLLNWALAFYLAYAVLHTAYPLVLQRRRPASAPGVWSQIFPPLTLVLLLIPLLKLDVVSLALWPCVLLVDALAIAAAWFTGSLVAIAVVLLLTLGSTGVWIFRIPVSAAPATSLLLVIAGFAAFFFGAAAYLSRKMKAVPAVDESLRGVFGDARSQLPAFSALLPFILLVMMSQRLTIANPSSIFGLALLLTVMVLGLAGIMVLEWLPACALVGVAAVEYAWHYRQFDSDAAGIAVVWYLVFYTAFALYPFLLSRRFLRLTGPWFVAALAGVVQFPLLYHTVRVAWPNDYLGVLPALFAIAPLASLFGVARFANVPEKTRLNQMAVFGGVALLFITLIFPIQFERQWLTVAWALEGAALLWLFHRVPHNGLRATGAVLLVTAFVRLALNPAVLAYHARSEVPILNWYLYTYGLTTAALFVGAARLAPPRAHVFGLNAPAVLNTLGTVLAFLLLNIEIADYFSAPGTGTLTFQFSGNFARDMTYTIAWSLFALALLLISMWRQLRPGRYAALALLGAAIVKLFFHDLARLDSLYRIAALLAVAVVAIVASFAYQRFLPRDDSPKPPAP